MTNLERSTQERGGHMVALNKSNNAVRWCDGKIETAAKIEAVTCKTCDMLVDGMVDLGQD